MNCPDCGKRVNRGNKYCNYCGKELVDNDAKYCTICGSKLNPRNGICIKCTMKKKKGEEIHVVKRVNKSDSRLNILFLIGVAMVLIAGFVLATTSWHSIPNWGRITMLIGLSLFFLLMSVLCDKEIKNKTFSLICFLLSMLFIIFTFINITYLDLFGHWFSFAGPGKFLCYAAISLLFLILMVITHLKYRSTWILLLSFIGFTMMVFFIFKYFGLGWLANLTSISLLLLLLYAYTARTKYRYVTIVCSLLMFIFDGIFLMAVRPEYNIIAGTIITVCNGLLLFLFGYLHKNKTIKVLSSITLYAFFMMFVNYSLCGSKYLLPTTAAVILLLLLMVLIINAINKNNDVKDYFSRACKMGSIISILLLIFCYSIDHSYHYYIKDFTSLNSFMLTHYINLSLTWATLIYTDIICMKEKTTVYKSIYATMLPFFIFMFLINALHLLSYYVTGVTAAVSLMIVALVVLLAYLFVKNSIFKAFLHCALYALLFIAFFYYVTIDHLKIESLEGAAALILPAMALFLYFKEKNELKPSLLFRWLSIIIFAFSFIHIIGTIDLLGFGLKISSIIVIVTLLLVLFLFNDDNVIKRFIPFTIFIPLSSLLKAYGVEYPYHVIVTNLYSLGVLYYFARTFTNKTFNILMIIGTSIILFYPTICMNPLLSTYASLISIMLIVIDLLSGKVRGLFIVGVIYWILNTLIELHIVWSHISIWAFLLIVGLIIIIISFVKLISNSNKKDK